MDYRARPRREGGCPRRGAPPIGPDGNKKLTPAIMGALGVVPGQVADTADGRAADGGVVPVMVVMTGSPASPRPTLHRVEPGNRRGVLRRRTKRALRRPRLGFQRPSGTRSPKLTSRRALEWMRQGAATR